MTWIVLAAIAGMMLACFVALQTIAWRAKLDAADPVLVAPSERPVERTSLIVRVRHVAWEPE